MNYPSFIVLNWMEDFQKPKRANPNPTTFFVLKMLSAFMSAAYNQMHFRLEKKQTLWTPLRLLLKEQSDQVYSVCNIGYLRT